MPSTHPDVVLIVQQARDDGLEMYAEFLRYHGFAPMAVSNARDALMLAPEADVFLPKPSLPIDLLRAVRLLLKAAKGRKVVRRAVKHVSTCEPSLLHGVHDSYRGVSR